MKYFLRTPFAFISLALTATIFSNLLSLNAIADEHVSTAPDDARVYFIQPNDGDVIQGPVVVKFGLSGMGVAPAGIKANNTGHHHLLINTANLPDLTQPLPATDQVKHFGKGQTETSLILAPGQHTLQLLLGNHLHIPHDKPVISQKITITVEE